MIFQRAFALLTTTILFVNGDATMTAARQAHADIAQRGGQLVAVQDDTWHVEAVFAAQRRLRLFVYDEQMRPLTGDRANQLSAAVDVSGQRVMFEHTGDVLEARVPTVRLPAEFIVTVRDGDRGRQVQVTFTFADYSVETDPNEFILPPTPIPGTLTGILTAMRTELGEARRGSQGASLTMTYVPAVRIRDYLLALEPYVSTLGPANRQRAEAAIFEGVRTAWLLHLTADDGISIPQIRQSGVLLEEAVANVLTIFGGAAQ